VLEVEVLLKHREVGEVGARQLDVVEVAAAAAIAAAAEAAAAIPAAAAVAAATIAATAAWGEGKNGGTP
jgi:hypothetical protein